jgi:acyl-CoA thioester hydrolase
MSRIKITLPSSSSERVSIPVRITDLNYGNHVGNDAIVSILHEARVQWLNKAGFDELRFAGQSLIMAGLSVEFIQESFYGDILEVDISCGEISAAGFELYYHLQSERNNRMTSIARAKTDMVCYNYELRKVTPLSTEAKDFLRGSTIP